MRSKMIIIFLSKLCLFLFYLIAAAGLLAIILESIVIAFPNGEIAESYGGFEPIYSTLNLDFVHQPTIYSDISFKLISLISMATALLFVLFLLWFLHKILNNIYKNSLFMYENTSLIFWLGAMFIGLGGTSEFLNGILSSKALNALQATNAKIEYINIEYTDFLINGIVLMIISVSLKKAVHAVEENNETI